MRQTESVSQAFKGFHESDIVIRRIIANSIFDCAKSAKVEDFW